MPLNTILFAALSSFCKKELDIHISIVAKRGDYNNIVPQIIKIEDHKIFSGLSLLLWDEKSRESIEKLSTVLALYFNHCWIKMVVNGARFRLTGRHFKSFSKEILA